MIISPVAYISISKQYLAYWAFVIFAQSSTDPEREVIKVTQSYFLVMNVFIVAFFVFLLVYFFVRMRAYRQKEQKSSPSIDLSPDELKALYGENAPDVLKSINKMSREELKLIAEKELEKQGIKPGEKDFFKGPLDWEDVDENFRPRPKIIRSEISFPDLDKIAEKYKSKEKKED